MTTLIIVAILAGLYLLLCSLHRLLIVVRRRWLAGLPERDRLALTHHSDQLDAAAREVGSLAMLCAMRYACLLVKAEELPAGEDRSRLVAKALRWERRADRLRADRGAS